MKKSLFACCLIAGLIFSSCSKTDDTPSKEPVDNSPNYYIGLSNNTDDNVSCKTRQLVRIELILSDGGMSSLESKFTLNPADVGMYSFHIPDMASYDIKVYTNDGQFVKWKHISLAPNDQNSASIIQIGTKNSDYLKGSMMSGLVPDESTVDCN